MTLKRSTHPHGSHHLWGMAAVFVILLIVRWEVLFSPAYFDYALGLWREAEYLARSNFDYYSLRYKCEPGISEIGGPRCYVVSIVPGTLALLFRLFPQSQAPVVIYHVAVLGAASFAIVGIARLLWPRVGPLTATLGAAAFATTPVLATQFDMLGFETFLVAVAVAWLLALDREHFVTACLLSFLGFGIKASGSLLTVALIAFFVLRFVADALEHRFSVRWIGLALFAGLLLAAEQGLLWWSGAFEQQQGGRLPLAMALAWFPDVVLLSVVALIGWLIAPWTSDPPSSPSLWIRRMGQIITNDTVGICSVMAILLLAVAIAGVRFVPRYAALAVPFLFAILPTVLHQMTRRPILIQSGLLLLIAINLINWNGILYPNIETSLERIAHLPGRVLRREGSLLERSHEYLANHRTNLEAIRIAAAEANGRPVITGLPHALYLAMPELGVVRQPLTVYSIYPVGPESISRIKSVADFEQDRPAQFLALRDTNTMCFAFTPWEVPRADESSKLLFTEPSFGDLQLYGMIDDSLHEDRHQAWIYRAKSRPTIAWLQVWSMHAIGGAAGVFSKAKELCQGPLRMPSTMLLAAASARIGQWQDTTDAVIEGEARYRALSDPRFHFRRTETSSESSFQRALDALAAGHEREANQLAFESAGQDALYLVPLVARYRLAQGLFTEGAGQQAAPIFRDLLKYSPEFWPAELGLIKIELQSGRRTEAQRSLEKLVAEHPSAEEPVILLALLLVESEPDRARAFLSKYLQDYPESDRARQCLDQMSWSKRVTQKIDSGHPSVESAKQAPTTPDEGARP
ncbi:tetratricopeptide repeat protein [bacterium]|nr:tetratricopeptide repeat protein [bacterium]